MPYWMPENNEPLPQDNELRSLQKIVDLLGGGSSGNGQTALKQIFHGAGDPNGIVVPTVGDAIYFQTDSVPANQIWIWQGAAWI